MKKPIRITVYPPTYAGGHFKVARIDNGISFKVPTQWWSTKEEQTVGSTLSPDDMQILTNNPDFEVSCADSGSHSSNSLSSSFTAHTEAVANALVQLGTALTTVRNEVAGLKTTTYIFLLIVAAYLFFHR